jgi:adenylate cyclase
VEVNVSVAPKREERRLAAILAADMVGYSRLMEADERGTIGRHRAYRQEIIDPKIAIHNGRIVKTTGDGLLVEFASAVEATECAVAIQRAMREREASVPEERRIIFRVGINLGDIVIDGDDILGDGVIIATRLERLAEPGGVCIAGNVREQVAGKLELDYRDLGEQRVKNIERPIRAYRVSLDGMSAGTGSTSTDASEDKPSIAVLPFDNMSGDPEQEYFADGITEDIITALSRFRSLLVIARNTSFVYKDRAVNVGAFGGEVGAKYVLEGSVRKSGDQVRVSAQLVEVRSGNHLWAERYDRGLEDVFSLQDEVTDKIVSSLAVHLEEAERMRSMRSDPNNLSAYDCCLRGRGFLHKGTKDNNLEARALFERAIELDPNYAAAYMELAETYFLEVVSNWTSSPEAATQKVFELARKAVELDPHDSRAHLSLAWGHYAMHSDFAQARTRIDEALRLNPNDFDNHCFKGWLSACSGDLAGAVACSNEALRRSPLVPDDCLRTRIAAEYLAGDYAAAIAAFGKMLRPDPNSHAWAAAAFAQQGRMEEAGARLAEFRHGLSIANAEPARDDKEEWSNYWSVAFPSIDSAARHHLHEGLRKAGLPV